MEISITHLDTACCIIEIDSLTILTDPVFDEPGKYYHHGYGAISKKTSHPTINVEELPKIDLILLSHPQHMDNFDKKGRKFAENVPLILSTKKIEKKYSNGISMIPWQTHKLTTPNNSEIVITATPAKHHPKWLPEFFSGKVIGFVIQHSKLTNSLYISGDTIFYKGIQETAEKFPNISISLLHVGGVEFRYLTGFGLYTMNRKGYVKTIKTINPKIAIPIHNNGWTHFKENDEGVKKELKNNVEEMNKTVFLEKGKKTVFNLD